MAIKFFPLSLFLIVSSSLAKAQGSVDINNLRYSILNNLCLKGQRIYNKPLDISNLFHSDSLDKKMANYFTKEEAKYLVGQIESYKADFKSFKWDEGKLRDCKITKKRIRNM